MFKKKTFIIMEIILALVLIIGGYAYFIGRPKVKTMNIFEIKKLLAAGDNAVCSLNTANFNVDIRLIGGDYKFIEQTGGVTNGFLFNNGKEYVWGGTGTDFKGVSYTRNTQYLLSTVIGSKALFGLSDWSRELSSYDFTCTLDAARQSDLAVPTATFFDLNPVLQASSYSDSCNTCVGLLNAGACFEVCDLSSTGGGGVDGAGIESITYKAEYEDHNKKIKFKDASPDGLGNNCARETDRFIISVSGGGTRVKVKIKAGKKSKESTLEGVGDSVLNDLGFEIKLVGISGNTYIFSVASKSNTKALSSIEFDFINHHSKVLSPADESTYTTTRNGLVGTGCSAENNDD